MTGPAGDIYGLGITLYELLTLEVPFGDLPPSALIHQVGSGELPRPRRLAPEIPKDLETIVLTAMARDPEGPLQDGRVAGRRPPAIPRRPPDPSPTRRAPRTVVAMGAPEPGDRRADRHGGGGLAAGGGTRLAQLRGRHRRVGPGVGPSTRGRGRDPSGRRERRALAGGLQRALRRADAPIRPIPAADRPRPAEARPPRRPRPAPGRARGPPPEAALGPRIEPLRGGSSEGGRRREGAPGGRRAGRRQR